MVQIPPEYSLDTARDLGRVATVHHECLKQFKEFKAAISGEISQRDYSGTGATLTDSDDGSAILFTCGGRTLRFSFTLGLNDSFPSGMITVHMLPAHSVESARHLGSFSFDTRGNSPEFVSTGPLNIGYGNAAMAIVGHYLMQALSIGFAQPQSPLPR